MPESYNIKAKVCLLGDSSVGKTSLVRRYVLDEYDDKYILTFGTKVSKKQMIIKRINENINLTLSIWDILGQEDFRNVQAMAIRGSKGALLVCDLTNKDSFKNITTWALLVKNVVGEIPIVLLANKSDLANKYAFTETDIESLSTQLNAPFFMTSAKFGDNVIKSFYKISYFVIDKILKETIKV